MATGGGIWVAARVAGVAAQMLEQIKPQSQRIAAQSQQIAQRDRAIKFKDAKTRRITFELARLKAWKFAARSESMNAEQRQLFEETLAADEASLQAQLEALQAQAATSATSATAPTAPTAAPTEPKRQPKRQALPAHLERIEHHHEPENTNCPVADCAQPMQRVGQDVSERLNIIPAQFFVHRHIRGKWAWPLLPGVGAAAGGAPDHRQRHAGSGSRGTHAGQPLRRSPAVLPARGHQRPLGRAHAQVNACGVVGARGCGVAAAVRHAPRVCAGLAGAAR